MVCERTGQDTLESFLRKCQLRWFGRVYRMDSNRLARQVMDWILPDFESESLRVSWT